LEVRLNATLLEIFRGFYGSATRDKLRSALLDAFVAVTHGESG